jgi:sugar phosphate isomerase/epimerase
MKDVCRGLRSSRRQVMAGALALAGARNPASAQQTGYAPRIVCNMYYYVQLFSTPFRFISIPPDPLVKKAAATLPSPQAPAPTGGTEWSREQWYTALSDVADAGYRRLEMISGTLTAKPIPEILALLEQYGLTINHFYHGGRLYPQEAQEKTIARAIEILDYCEPLKLPEFMFDPFGDRGPISDEEARLQNRGFDRMGRIIRDRGMKMLVHNHSGPMRYGAKEWLGVLRNTDPTLVSMCLDLDWTLHAGTDPFPLLYEAGDKGRLGALHLRTSRNGVTDQTMEDGGDIDFYRVAAYLKKIRFDGTLVEETERMKETKVTRSARENKRLARVWCEKVFGVSAKA